MSGLLIVAGCLLSVDVGVLVVARTPPDPVTGSPPGARSPLDVVNDPNWALRTLPPGTHVAITPSDVARVGTWFAENQSALVSTFRHVYDVLNRCAGFAGDDLFARAFD